VLSQHIHYPWYAYLAIQLWCSSQGTHTQAPIWRQYSSSVGTPRTARPVSIHHWVRMCFERVLELASILFKMLLHSSLFLSFFPERRFGSTASGQRNAALSAIYPH
jgi:hypothetical protein